MTDMAWESRGAFKTASKDTVFLVYSLTTPPSVKAASEFTRHWVAALLLKFSFLNGVWGPTKCELLLAYDNDLTQDHSCHTLAICNWMTDYCLYVSPITLVLHSLNPVGTNVV